MDVLLVEDNPGDARLVSEFLAEVEAGATVRHVPCLAEARGRLLSGATQDVILLDLGLPDATGLEGLGILRREAPDVPIVLLTGLDDERLALQALEEGAQDFIPKSNLDGAVLHRAIRYAVERKKAQRELRRRAAEMERANRALRNFLATASHELQTPISNLLSAAEILVSHGAAEFAETREEFLTIIQSESARMSRLVQQMLEITALEGGLRTTQLEDCDLRGLMEAVALNREWQGIRLVLDLPPTPAPMIGDRPMLERLLGKLLHNAARFAPDTETRVSLRPTPIGYEVRVADRGPGVSGDRKEDVFEPFYQTEDVLTGKPPGLGLGLAIARQIARAHGGDIRCEDNPGGGASFVVTLPRENRLASVVG